MVLVGQPCYPRPAWVEALFSAGPRSSDGDGDGDGDGHGHGDGHGDGYELDHTSVLRPRQLSPAAATATGNMGNMGNGAHPEAALLLRRLGELDPYADCYDP